MKQRKNILDPFAERLAAWDEQKLTLAQIVEQLHLDGCDASASMVSRYLESLRQAKLQAQLLGQIASGARQVQQLEKAFAKTPAPELDTIMSLQRVLVMKLATQGQADPELLKLADQLTRTVLEYTSGRTKFAQKERELKLAEEKFQLDFCERILDQATREMAERIANSNMSNAEKIAAMRKAAFADVDALEASGEITLPKRPK